jgi:hypothetical protein
VVAGRQNVLSKKIRLSAGDSPQPVVDDGRVEEDVEERVVVAEEVRGEDVMIGVIVGYLLLGVFACGSDDLGEDELERLVGQLWEDCFLFHYQLYQHWLK